MREAHERIMVEWGQKPFRHSIKSLLGLVCFNNLLLSGLHCRILSVDKDAGSAVERQF